MIDCLNICISSFLPDVKLFAAPAQKILFLTSIVELTSKGVDIAGALSEVNVLTPYYRFNVMVQKALELCNDVKSFGGSLLSAFEKRDAEDLALLRSGHETRLLDATRQVKEQQVKEAEETLNGLNISKDIATKRRDYYRDLRQKKLNPEERAHLDKLASGNERQKEAMQYELNAKYASLIPDLTIGTSGVARANASLLKRRLLG
jgi:hypothetical protein